MLEYCRHIAQPYRRTLNSKWPSVLHNTVFSWSLALSLICRYPLIKSSVVKSFKLPKESRVSWVRGIGYASFCVTALTSGNQCKTACFHSYSQPKQSVQPMGCLKVGWYLYQAFHLLTSTLLPCFEGRVCIHTVESAVHSHINGVQ